MTSSAENSTISSLLTKLSEVIRGNEEDTRKLFFVIATQNPIETEGVYPLPVSQKDRFLMKLRIGYPEEKVEAA